MTDKVLKLKSGKIKDMIKRFHMKSPRLKSAINSTKVTKFRSGVINIRRSRCSYKKNVLSIMFL